MGVSVSVAYPPDTDTPGFAAENLRKPDSTRIISEGARTLTATEVAAKILNGIEADRCDITFDAQAEMLLRFGGAVAPAVRRMMNRKLTRQLDGTRR